MNLFLFSKSFAIVSSEVPHLTVGAPTERYIDSVKPNSVTS